ncbi:exopolyphosphatase/guanosine-5'-triphosphate,3'-diphosphate pyrophosphatase [Nitrospirillum amazonense]|uniref:Exopolyphosphatase/guanosine-5'-triphosphate, 3'-diphosphate pyrophosphatase n=1 Tax=Nitrospirillum amazonense TaxID=28077 RepID=A0A560EXV7_9PROT|nr:Ppx/GppA phosphatase family protein [Nitrospirillum amazonense]TWB14176.1 exopolyphosphatase/guanosine-5'-triphosphate,3'-diphosphate pyrophosphatase [Nitrospirillum amazonense]
MSETGVQPLPETRAPRGAGPGEPVRRPVLAALDLGTNNCRLLIARPGREGFRIIDAFSRIVRLGEGLSRTNALSDEAMARTVAALKICGNKMRRRGVTDVRAVATEACRRAANCGTFIDRVAEETGIRIEIITAEEEARLALAGCAALLNRRIPRALVFDIGGGSTEIMWLSFNRGRPALIDQVSVPQGVVSLTETFGGDRVLPEAYRGMVDTVGAALADFDARNDIRREVAAGRVQMLGTSGTVTTLAGIRLGLTRYDRSQVDGSWLGLEEARAISKSLLCLDYAGRSAHPCIGHDRADLVIAGCAVLEAIWERWPVENLRIADRGVREGILTELMAATRGRS